MALTGTYNFNPAASSLTHSAFARIGMRRSAVLIEHLTDAHNEFNLLQVEISNHQPNLWRTEIFPITLVEDDASYDLPARMIAVQDIYMRMTINAVSTDRILAPLSHLEFDAQANKSQTGIPTSYLIDKTLTPTITLVPIPDDAADYTVYVRLLSQPQDVSLKNNLSVDMPYRYLDCVVAGLAYRLARIYAPDKEMARKMDYAEALAAAQRSDTMDSVNMYVTPDFSGYYR